MISLKLEESQFWELTPFYFSKLQEAYEREQQRKDFRFGVVASILANQGRDKRKRSKPFEPRDFFKSLQDQEKQITISTDEMMYQQVVLINAMLGGSINTEENP